MTSSCSGCGRPSATLDATWRLCRACHQRFLADVELEVAWEELPDEWKRIESNGLSEDELRRVKVQRVRAFEKMQRFQTEFRLANR